MVSQKLEDILNLSLESSDEQRQRSGVLNVGFDRAEQSWELIIKYSGSLEGLREQGIVTEELLAGYAIVNLPQSLIPVLVAAPQVEYVEMPRNLLNGLYEAKRVSCILPLTGSGAGVSPGGGRTELSGNGVLVAVLDSGIDYYLPDFRNADGSSRIAYLWDQTLDAGTLNGRMRQDIGGQGTAETSADSGEEGEQTNFARYAPPEGFVIGVEFSKEQIDEALATGNRDSAFALAPSLDRSGHGTSVAAIVAGGSADPLLRGVAAGAELLVVKLANLQNGFPHTTELMRAVAWALRKAQTLGKPIAMNISFGNSYGPHDGSSLLSRFLDNAAESWRTVICVGSGNEGAAFGHAAGRLTTGGTQTVELVVADYERTLSVQLWKNYADIFAVTLRTPSGQDIAVQFSQTGRQDILTSATEVLIYVGQPSPYSVQQEIFFDFLPRNTYMEAGVWTIRLEGVQVVSGEYQMYLPGQEVRAAGTRFVRPAAELTLTIPGTAQKVLTVGASQPVYEAYADFSGRGAPLFLENETVFADTKPDLVAPGVDLLVPAAGGSTQRVTGTSFATPLVTGTAALLMEWGIVRGNDPYLYGEKMKAYLRRGAKPLRGENVYPNEKVGYGALCASQSLPK
ncbi:MAG: S8 family peptidase [Eubacteriales bacterium]|nr:S8 family peptidase [Eubacteriales bacterium]